MVRCIFCRYLSTLSRFTLSCSFCHQHHSLMQRFIFFFLIFYFFWVSFPATTCNFSKFCMNRSLLCFLNFLILIRDFNFLFPNICFLISLSSRFRFSSFKLISIFLTSSVQFYFLLPLRKIFSASFLGSSEFIYGKLSKYFKNRCRNI